MNEFFKSVYEKLNIKKSITAKLFLTSMAFFMSFITLLFIFQSLFFEKFYESRKTSALKSNLQKFEFRYNNTSNVNEVLTIITEFEERNNSKIVILDKEGKLNFVTSLNEEKQDSAKVRIIRNIIRRWTSDPEAFLNIKKNNKPVTYIYHDTSYGINNIVCVLPNSNLNEVIFAVSSLQPVNEAALITKEFYFYVFAGAALLIIILSIIYSNMITKPLLVLNKSASKMAGLDFSEECDVDRSDEIGNLAHTLNFLSENLSSALTSLRTANEKLTQDIQKERQLEKMRRDFVAGVSHELKTPISLIEGYAEGLKDNIAQGEERDYYLDVIIDEAEKMGSLVSDMLDLSQLEHGSFKLNKEEFYLDTLINSTVKKFCNILSEKNINVDLSIKDNIKVLADRHRIEQVIMNFMTNAIRHTKEGGTIIINMLPLKDTITVEIENEGSQISEDELAKIWDMFYKIDKSRNRSLGGTGLGLAIVKNILLLHESNFGAKNTEKGVKFYFSLDIIP